MKSTLPIFYTLLFSGCSFDKSNSLIEDGGTTELIDASGAPDAEIAARPPGFSSTFETWLVPDTGTSRGAFAQGAGSGNEYWFLLDIDADGTQEFVQTMDPSINRVWLDASGSYWRQYALVSGGFDQNYTRFAVPEGGPASGFFTKTAITVSLNWDLVDIDGDSFPDLVELTDPATSELWTDGPGLAWHVYRGQDNGFGVLESWIVPNLGPATLKQIRRTGGDGCWTLLDTGSGKPDLIHSAASRSIGIFDPSTPNWHVYANTGSGFSDALDSWTVPLNERPEGFFASDDPTLKWKTFDLDGDATLELVQTHPADITDGPFYDGATPFWKVFKAMATGFEATNTQWTLPSGSVPFDSTDRAEDSLQWATLDIDGDGLLDLVHTANSAAATPAVWGAPNSDQWKVYLGTGSGFSPTVTAWPVPDSETDSGFFALNQSDAEKQWLTTDLDGDGQVELVQTADPSTGAVWLDGDGNPYWRVYRRATN